jgi:hypothetical protein
MLLSEAKAYIGKVCSICWRDRTGAEMVTVSKIYDATFVPLYGGYVVTDSDDIRLDRISSMTLAETVPQMVPGTALEERVAA